MFKNENLLTTTCQYKILFKWYTFVITQKSNNISLSDKYNPDMKKKRKLKIGTLDDLFLVQTNTCDY